METVGLEVLLFLFGAIILSIGLFGRIETQWFKVGSDSLLIRASSVAVGALFIGVSLIKADLFSSGNADKAAELTKQNTALQAKILDLEARLNQQQVTTSPSGSPLSKAHDDLGALGDRALLEKYNKAQAKWMEDALRTMDGFFNPEAIERPEPSKDGDDSISSARSIRLGERVRAEIQPYTDRDFYKISIPTSAPERLRVIVTKLDVQGLVSEVAVYDQNSQVIKQESSLSAPTLSFSIRRPPGDHLYLHVASQGLPSVPSFPQQGPYELLVQSE
jgi:hypothetical protein